ncbi:MAG TPA: FRG domain-containing protein [Gemmatimonadaceae bacterium]|nr:FRG domain-containing protein [Gemmatimonadaceae bacterium]
MTQTNQPKRTHAAFTEIVIRSLGEFVDRVTPAEPDAVSGRRRDTGVYRGAPHANAPILTSLDRLGGTHPPHTKAELEEHVLRNYIRYARPHVDGSSTNDWEELFSAQHHGVPTRLLDWTYSPLVAAFFATRPSRQDEHDRAVWRLDWQRVHRGFKLPPLALLPRDLDDIFGEGKHATPWQLFNRKSDKDAFALLVEPPSLDQRIVAQAAVFTMCSDRTRSFDEFLRAHDLADALTKYIIPADVVDLMRDQLDLVGVDERRLFPDLDGVAAAIRRYYA